MSQELLNELKFLKKFAGIPSYDMQIEHIERLLSTTDGVSQAQFNAVNQAQDLEIDGKADEVLGPNRPVYFVGGPLANNSNNGETVNTPMATTEALFRGLDMTTPKVVNLLGDVIETESYVLPVGTAAIQFNGSNGLVRKLTFSGAGRQIFSGTAVLRYNGVEVINDREDGAPCVQIWNGGGIRYANGAMNVTQRALDGPGKGYIYEITPFTHFLYFNTVVRPNAVDREFLEIHSPQHSRRIVAQ